MHIHPKVCCWKGQSMMLKLFVAVLILASSAQAFLPRCANSDQGRSVPLCRQGIKRPMALDSSVNSYHSSLNENKRLFSKLTDQVDSLRTDITKLKGGASGPPKNYSFAGKKDYKVRPWYATDNTASAHMPASGITPSYRPITSVSDITTPLNGETSFFGLDMDLRRELQAVSAELQKVAAENEALKQIQLMHEKRERELQNQVAEQLAIYDRAERELEQVKAQSLKQLAATNREAAARLADETAEFKARLFEAERMVIKMKSILERVEERMDIKLLDDSTRRFSVNGVVDNSETRWGKVKRTWGKVKSVFKSPEHLNGSNGNQMSDPTKKYAYEQPMPANPRYQISRVEKIAS